MKTKSIGKVRLNNPYFKTSKNRRTFSIKSELKYLILIRVISVVFEGKERSLLIFGNGRKLFKWTSSSTLSFKTLES